MGVIRDQEGRIYLGCFECQSPASHMHHVIPESLGGTQVIPLCEECHGKIHDHTWSGISHRIKYGQAVARANGKTWGGSRKGVPKKVSLCAYIRIHEYLALGLSVTAIARELQLSRPTIYRVKNKELVYSTSTRNGGGKVIVQPKAALDNQPSQD